MKTQCERILTYLRRVKKATNVDLMILGTGHVQVLCPHKRVREIEVEDETLGLSMLTPTERIERHYIKSKGGARIVMYHLVRV